MSVAPPSSHTLLFCAPLALGRASMFGGVNLLSRPARKKPTCEASSTGTGTRDHANTVLVRFAHFNIYKPRAARGRANLQPPSAARTRFTRSPHALNNIFNLNPCPSESPPQLQQQSNRPSPTSPASYLVAEIGMFSHNRGETEQSRYYSSFWTQKRCYTRLTITPGRLGTRDLLTT